MTATSTILAALRSSTLPVEAQAFLASISEGEGTIDFATLYSGGDLENAAADSANITMVGVLREWTGPLTAFPAWSGASAAGGLVSTAAGFCQDTHTTWNDYAAKFGVSDFTPASQISFNWQLAELRFGTPMNATLLQALQAGETAMIPAYLVKTWPGGASSSFPTRYAANLAALQAAQPTELTLALPAEVTATDAKGNPVTILLKASAAAAAVAASLLLTPSAPPIERQPNVFSTSTFVFQQGPDGRAVPVPLR